MFDFTPTLILLLHVSIVLIIGLVLLALIYLVHVRWADVLLGGTGTRGAALAVGATVLVDAGGSGAARTHEHVALTMAAVRLSASEASVRRRDHSVGIRSGRVVRCRHDVSAASHVARGSVHVGRPQLVWTQSTTTIWPAVGGWPVGGGVLVGGAAAASAARDRHGVLVVGTAVDATRVTSILRSPLLPVDDPLSHVLGARGDLIVVGKVDVVTLGDAYVAGGGLGSFAFIELVLRDVVVGRLGW